MDKTKDSVSYSKDNISPSLGDNKLSDDNYDSDKYRMWAAISFAVMLLVVGVPLWWKTTEVERSPLPYSKIAALDPSNLSISTSLLIFTQYPTLYNEIRNAFLYHFKQKPSLFRVNIASVKLDSLLSPRNISLESVEQAAREGKIASEPGPLLLVQLPHSEDINPILVSSHRIVYFSDKAEVEALVECVMGWILEESELMTKMLSMLDPESALPENSSSNTRLKAATSYDFVFSVVISDPARVNLSLDMKALIKKYVEPLLNQLIEVGEHRARSQWVHMLDLSMWSKRESNSSVHVIQPDSLPLIITPLEKRMGSGVCGVAGCVQLVLYVTHCDISPLVFGSDSSLSITSAPWGSVQVLNPSKESCASGSYIDPNPSKLMATFISHIHSLLGFTNPPLSLSSQVFLKRKIGPELRDWQLDSLYRMRVMEQLVSASLTLKSLAKLLGEISNIVINSEVARCVEASVVSAEEGLSKLSQGHLIPALRASRQAFIHSEKAFTDPSLLALLYFPDDQKYAVYIPLFLPIMIPVLMSLRFIYKWPGARPC